MLSLYPIYVSFPLTPLDRVEGLNMICLKRVNAMDTARISLNLLPEEAKKYITPGSPIKFYWESNGVRDEFVGYVHSFRPQVFGYQNKTVVVAISAGYPLFNQTGRTFYRVGIHNVAEEIADDHRFQLDVDRHPLMQEQILQGQDSDWSLLARLAKEWGYVLMLDGVTLSFRRLDELVQDNTVNAEQEATEQIMFRGRGSGIISFEPSFSAVSSSPVTSTVGSGIGAVEANPFQWQTKIPSQGLFQETVTRAVQSELEGELAAYASQMEGLFPFRATATMLAPIGKKPLDIYFIDHEGRRLVWAIQSVKHIVNGPSYVGEMILGSDGVVVKKRAPKEKRIDVAALLRRNRRSKLATPTIIDTRPYYLGAGASAIIHEQRWKADLIHVRQEAA